MYIYIYAFSRHFYPKRLTLFYQYVCSLGIEPTTFCAANAMLYHWATGTQNELISNFMPATGLKIVGSGGMFTTV